MTEEETVFCPRCGKETEDKQAFCTSCGAPLTQAAGPGTTAPMAGISPKSRLATALLAFFLGMFGAHRFYTGNTGTAIVMLVLTVIGIPLCLVIVGIFILIGVRIWSLVDFVFAVAGEIKDSNGLLIKKW